MQIDEIIKEVAEKRKHAGLTQKELAERTGLTQSVIARLESGKAIPQVDTLLKVLEPLGCTIKIVPDGAIKKSCSNE